MFRISVMHKAACIPEWSKRGNLGSWSQLWLSRASFREASTHHHKNVSVKYPSKSKLNNLMILVPSSGVSCLQGCAKVNNWNWRLLIISLGCCWSIICAWFGLQAPGKRLGLVLPPFVKIIENTIKLKVSGVFFPNFKVFFLNLNKCYLSRFPSLQGGYFMPQVEAVHNLWGIELSVGHCHLQPHGF